MLYNLMIIRYLQRNNFSVSTENKINIQSNVSLAERYLLRINRLGENTISVLPAFYHRKKAIDKPGTDIRGYLI